MTGSGSGSGQTIVLCYDGSEGARGAIDEARRVLKTGDAIVLTVWQRVMYVVSGYGATSMAAPMDTRDIDVQVEATAKRTAEEGVERATSAGFVATAEVLEATSAIWDTVLQFADEHDAAAIVLGSRGLSGVKSLFLGSVSHGVVQHSHRPLLIVPPAARA